MTVMMMISSKRPAVRYLPFRDVGSFFFCFFFVFGVFRGVLAFTRIIVRDGRHWSLSG